MIELVDFPLLLWKIGSALHLYYLLQCAVLNLLLVVSYGVTLEKC